MYMLKVVHFGGTCSSVLFPIVERVGLDKPQIVDCAFHLIVFFSTLLHCPL